MSTAKIESITGRPIPVRGDDIDTDRIIPARYLRCVTFEGLEEHAFEDDRRDSTGKLTGRHPFDVSKFAGASILLARRNFGCGSSREHAPQALMRWGIKAFVGESFAEIFFANCIALGLPCLTVSNEEIEKLMGLADKHPDQEFTIDISSAEIVTPSLAIRAAIPSGPREAFLRGTWDATGALLQEPTQVDRVAKRLPYMTAFK